MTAEMISAIIIVSLFGLFFVYLGYLIWKKEKISLLHDYHYDKVKEEDKKSFCAMSGQGVLLIGLGFLVAGIVVAVADPKWGMVPVGIGLVLGIARLIHAGIRYN